MCWNLTIAWMHRGRVDRLNAVSCTNFTKFKNFAQPNSWWAAFKIADFFGCVRFHEMFSNHHVVQILKVYIFSRKQPLLAASFPLPKHITRVLLCQSMDSAAGARGPNIQKKITTPSCAEDVNFFILFVQQATNYLISWPARKLLKWKPNRAQKTCSFGQFPKVPKIWERWPMQEFSNAQNGIFSIKVLRKFQGLMVIILRKSAFRCS